MTIIYGKCKSCGKNIELVRLKMEDGLTKETICVRDLQELQYTINHNVRSAIKRNIKRFPLRVRPGSKGDYYLDIASDLEFSDCFITIY